ncbi:MAG TPA: DUF4124 domain-containing protein [Gammaproteobacteria bacterium]|nr:DUF4124 domain-containing protein [Gammaproteobacteria bacterium]
MLKACCFLFLAALGALPAAAGADVYRWVDENGVVHYGDRIPPEASRHDREVLSERGIALESLPGERTPEQRAAEARQRGIEAERRAVRERRLNRDRVLLSTYLSVQEIEMLRDRRLELLDAQTRLTEQHLENLHKRFKSLESEAERYDYPPGTASDKPPLPADLEDEMLDVNKSVQRYETSLERRKAERGELSRQFADDIGRFRELKGLK